MLCIDEYILFNLFSNEINVRDIARYLFHFNGKSFGKSKCYLNFKLYTRHGDFYDCLMRLHKQVFTDWEIFHLKH